MHRCAAGPYDPSTNCTLRIDTDWTPLLHDAPQHVSLVALVRDPLDRSLAAYESLIQYAFATASASKSGAAVDPVPYPWSALLPAYTGELAARLARLPSDPPERLMQGKDVWIGMRDESGELYYYNYKEMRRKAESE